MAVVAVPSATATALVAVALASSAVVVSRILPVRPFWLNIALICISLRVDSAIEALTASIE